jgi:hypothetical protein
MFRYRRGIVFLLILAMAIAVSCSQKEEKESQKEGEELSKEDLAIGSVKDAKFVSDKVSFGVYFDEEGKQNTMTLPDDANEVKVYIIIKYPEDMEITAVDWRLELPEGLEVESDKCHPGRNIMMGTFSYGMSERFPCEKGPKLLLHMLTMSVTGKLENAEVLVLPSKKSEFLGVAECKEGFPVIRATSYKGVINPVK